MANPVTIGGILAAAGLSGHTAVDFANAVARGDRQDQAAAVVKATLGFQAAVIGARYCQGGISSAAYCRSSYRGSARPINGL